MRIVIVREDGVVGVDGVGRAVDLSALDPLIRVVHFDTAAGAGHVEYVPGAALDVQVRDEEAERAAEEAAGGDRAKLAALRPIYKLARARRGNQAISDFSPFQSFLDLWQAAAPAPTLAQLKAKARHAIDRAAGDVRLRYITAVPGQEATYFIKERQAEAFKAAGYAGDVPAMVQAEADATGQTAQQACDAILAMRDFWIAKAAAIERQRRRGKLDVDAAPDADGIDAAQTAALAALNAL